MTRLNDYEQEMLAGAHGEPRKWAMEMLLKVARMFDADELVEVSQVHLMADTEATGEEGLRFVEWIGSHDPSESRVVIPSVTDPRGADFSAYERIKQDERFVDMERRADAAFRKLGFMMTDTCINYQTINPPVLGEHIAFGDTGSSIYANSVLGARTNFEGGPSALAASLTGRVPRYGFHLDERRRGTTRFVVEAEPRSLSDWGALGGIVGRQMKSYWEVPVIEGIGRAPTSDEIKHFGAALASFGSTPLFHIIGITPEAPRLDAVFDGTPPAPRRIGAADVASFYKDFGPKNDRLDVVVFAAPQLSLFELETLSNHLRGRKISDKVTLIAATSPEMKTAADRMGFTDAIEDAGGIVLKGVCFYQMHAREIGEANGWRSLLSNSAKLVNILGGYGYETHLADMEACVDAAVSGRLTV
ncbi:MAG: aconitase X [Rhodomicrobiaceae bacterium]